MTFHALLNNIQRPVDHRRARQQPMTRIKYMGAIGCLLGSQLVGMLYLLIAFRHT